MSSAELKLNCFVLPGCAAFFFVSQEQNINSVLGLCLPSIGNCKCYSWSGWNVCVFDRGVADVFQFQFTKMKVSRFQQRPISSLCCCMSFQGYGSCNYECHFILFCLSLFPLAWQNMLGSYSCL